MPYAPQLAEKVREHLSQYSPLDIEEKRMFRGLAFIVNGKMCVNISGNNLMCRFDPELTHDIALRKGFLPVIMKGKTIKGYCYVEPIGFRNTKDFQFWMQLCLAFNERAKSSKKENNYRK